jgi:DNA processing protein
MKNVVALMALARLRGLSLPEKRELLETVPEGTSLFDGKGRLQGTTPGRGEVRFEGWQELESELEGVLRIGAGVLTIEDADYPPLLRNIPDAPLILFRKGPLKVSTETFAVVGSRRGSPAGQSMAEKIGETLSAAGITVVSGLARGIDGAAHRGGLKEKGKTVAVLGCGIDIPYPPEHKRLYGAIAEEGLLLTEYAQGEPPLPFHFPERNRIIAGLSRGVLVVEAAKKSGALITARLALEYGREVLAVPGPVYADECKGANTLIKEGARLVDGIEDIFTACFPGYAAKKEQAVDMNEDERYIYSFLGHEASHVEDIIERSGIETKRVMAVLTSLEMKDLIRAFPGGFFIKANPKS